ncbi:hypothetical protein GGP76_003338, partial [Salinibacter ruber]|nr:hypothetical protein [Salinibacter ruber]
MSGISVQSLVVSLVIVAAGCLGAYLLYQIQRITMQIGRFRAKKRPFARVQPSRDHPV